MNGKSFTPTVTTVYTLTAGNACGTVSSTHTITVTPVNVTVSATPSVICTGYASTLMALSPVNIYSWTPGTTGQSIIVSPQSTTVYTVTATNGTCIGTNTLLLKTNTSPTITVSHTFVSVCQGGTISVGAAGAGNNGTYTWMPGSLTGASITTIPPGTTSYSVSGTNSLGCTSSAQIPVVVVNGPTITANASANLVCNGQTVTLTAGGAGTYTWNFGSTAASTVVNINSPVNVFTVTGTASGNSCTASQTVAVAAITPSVTFTPSVTICNGQTATLTASGATSYSWNNISSGTSGQLVTTPTITSQYTLTANTQSLNVSCLSTDFSTVTVNATPTVSAVATITTTICNGNTNTITAQGASTYTWIALNVFTAKAIVTPTGNTSYTVIGENAEGCQSVAKVQVNVKGCVGIEETAFARSIQIFPNPADETLFISSEAQLNLALYNTNGKLVRTIYTNEGTVQIDITELPAGIYLLKSMTSDQTMIRKVMIR